MADMPHCTGPGCHQGRQPCPTREACCLPEPTRAPQYRPTYELRGPYRRPMLASVREALRRLFNPS